MSGSWCLCMFSRHRKPFSKVVVLLYCHWQWLRVSVSLCSLLIFSWIHHFSLFQRPWLKTVPSWSLRMLIISSCINLSTANCWAELLCLILFFSYIFSVVFHSFNRISWGKEMQFWLDTRVLFSDVACFGHCVLPFGNSSHVYIRLLTFSSSLFSVYFSLDRYYCCAKFSHLLF